MSWSRSASKLNIDLEKKDIGKPLTPNLSKENIETQSFFFQKIIFLLIGLSALHVWNTLLNLNFLKTHYYGFQLSGLVVSSISGLFIKIPRFLLPFFLGGLILSSVFFQIVYFAVDNETTFLYLCAAIFFLMGLCAGFAQTIACSIAANMKVNLSGFICGGFGISGIFSFIVNLILDQFVDEGTKHSINKQKVIALYLVCQVCIVITIVLCVIKLPLKEPKVDYKSGDLTEGELEKDLKWHEVLKDVHKPFINEFFSNCLTLHLFPTVGHNLWKRYHNISNKNITVIIGMYQIFDCVSRYLPNVVSGNKYLKFLIFPSKTLLICNIFRLGFIAWFILNAVSKNSFFASIYQQCICMSLFALTNGWFCTLPYVTFVSEMKESKTKNDVSRASNYMVIAMSLGLSIGVWSGLIYEFIFPAPK